MQTLKVAVVLKKKFEKQLNLNQLNNIPSEPNINSGESRDYSFEYSDTSYSVKLLCISLASFILLLCAMPIFIDTIGGSAGIIIVFVVPFLIFWFNRKKIKRNGKATITDNYIEFELGKGIQRIEFKNIKNYLVQHYGGIYMRIQQIDNKKFTISTNENFCDPSAFEILCDDFETVIHNARKKNSFSIIRKKSLFEKKWFFILLIIITILFIGAIFRGMATDKSSNASFFTSLGIIIAMWAAYFTTRMKAKNKPE